MKNRYLALLIICFPFLAAFGQSPEPEMADAFRSNGKIYVVVASLLMVMAGMVVFLIILEKRISTLENKHKNEN
jgi:hypothetical protein